jgi:membrane-associated phospholipid phosphatase
MRFWRGVVVAAVVVFAAPDAAAEKPQIAALRYDTRVDVAVTSMGATWLIMSELLKSRLVPEKCRWCYRTEDGKDLLNPYDGWVRHRLIWQDTRAADITSSVLVFALEPVSALGLTALAASHDQAINGFPLDALIIAEATVVAGVLNQVTKFGFARERPFVHFLPRAPNVVRELTDSPSDDNLSFFSGHTNLAFVIATSSGTVATLRGYRLAPLVWGAGLTMAASTGYLRIAADKHYFSDVMVAAVIGSIVGVGVPLLFHSKAPGGTTTTSTTAQALLTPPVHPAFSVSGKF